MTADDFSVAHIHPVKKLASGRFNRGDAIRIGEGGEWCAGGATRELFKSATGHSGRYCSFVNSNPGARHYVTIPVFRHIDGQLTVPSIRMVPPYIQIHSASAGC